MSRILFVGGPADGEVREVDVDLVGYIVAVTRPVNSGANKYSILVDSVLYKRFVLAVHLDGKLEFMRYQGITEVEACQKLLRGYRP